MKFKIGDQVLVPKYNDTGLVIATEHSFSYWQNDDVDKYRVDTSYGLFWIDESELEPISAEPDTDTIHKRQGLQVNIKQLHTLLKYLKRERNNLNKYLGIHLKDADYNVLIPIINKTNPIESDKWELE